MTRLCHDHESSVLLIVGKVYLEIQGLGGTEAIYVGVYYCSVEVCMVWDELGVVRMWQRHLNLSQSPQLFMVQKSVTRLIVHVV